jgi:predicted dehydrogenase
VDIRWGVVGPGRIAEKVVQDFAVVDGARAVAVASRSLARARDFADRHGLDRAHGSYAAILADPDVDVLYVATPHPQHAAVASAAITAGKALLVEKSFTATIAGAAEVVELARSRGVFVMEAMWTRFQPAVVALREAIASGAIGEVRCVQADLGVERGFDPADRLFSRELGGGALLDLGVYVVSSRRCCSAIPTR